MLWKIVWAAARVEAAVEMKSKQGAAENLSQPLKETGVEKLTKRDEKRRVVTS